MECASILMERGDWSSINGDSINESNFMENLFINSSLSDMVGCNDNGSYYTTDTTTTTDSNCYSVSQQYSQESLYSESSDDVAYQNHENYILSDHDQFFAVNNSSLPVEFCLNTNGVIQVFPGNFMDRNHSFNNNNNVDDSETYVTQNENFVSTKYEMVEIEPVEEVKSNDDLLEVGCKRSRNSEVQKGKRNTRSKKSRKLESDELQNCPSLEKQNSGTCSSEELLSGGRKTRASRGAATDPQSLYARKRRERINEKLRTLQKLVPNGTKVDLSTMLEEAVSYVKFLQLQIKLLSSDELWMYAPLAYNGMDIGLDSKLNSLLQ
ncbi:uncharacterized protein LOC141590571 [Silene latifolia]|uniref:uncharacterized protein LOC141590571 n=1 Tax=Silene latifolia TaxID=37657 RepID=UPI003D778E64